nr:hypothetical protein [Sphingomonas faeni]
MHAFQKKTQATPQRDIDLAASRLRTWRKSDGNLNVRQRVPRTGRHSGRGREPQGTLRAVGSQGAGKFLAYTAGGCGNRLGITPPFTMTYCRERWPNSRSMHW